MDSAILVKIKSLMSEFSIDSSIRLTVKILLISLPLAEAPSSSKEDGSLGSFTIINRSERTLKSKQTSFVKILRFKLNISRFRLLLTTVYPKIPRHN